MESMDRVCQQCANNVGQDGILRQVDNLPVAPVNNRRAACQAAPQPNAFSRSWTKRLIAVLLVAVRLFVGGRCQVETVAMRRGVDP
jgi:hypothetical protein